MMSAHMMWRCGLHFGVTWWQVRQVLCTIHMPRHVTSPRRGSQLLLCASVVVGVHVLGRLPNFRVNSSPRSLNVGSTWYRTLVGAGVRSLSDCLSHAQWWQRCLVCDKKVLQAAGELAMAAQVLHVTNYRQSVRLRIREGMRGRSLGRPSSAPPCGCGGDLQEAIVSSSLGFNKLAPLHFHNQQLHSLTVDHEFVDVNGYHSSLRAMVIHIGATKDQGTFVVHILVRDEWWLCDDASVTRGRPPADSRKMTFLLYERTPTEMVGPSQGGSQRGACNRGARGAPCQSVATTVDRCVQSMGSSTPLPAMALATGDPQSTNHIEEVQLSPSQSTAPIVDSHAPSLPSNTQLAAMALPTGDPEYTTHVGDAQPSTEFIEVVAKL